MDQPHLDMIERLRRQEPEPYRDGPPVPRVIRVIRVVGRRTGRPRPFPVNVTLLDGCRYLCSATRNRDRVKNLLAAGQCHIERDDRDLGHRTYRPIMVEGHQAAVVLAAYLPQIGYHDPQLPFDVDAPIAEMARAAHLTAVIRLDPS